MIIFVHINSSIYICQDALNLRKDCIKSLAYMDFNHKMDPEIRRYIEQYYQAYLSEMKLNRSDMAYKALSHHDEMLIIYFNGHCNSILTQYKLLEKHKQQVMLGLKKIKRKLFF